MRFTAILSVAAFAGAALAQNQQGQPGAGCPAQNVLTTCLGTQSSRIAQCKVLDYACMCQVQADVLQCYDQCPNDVNRSTEQSKLTAYCVAASAAAPAPAPTTTAPTSGSQTSAPAPSETESGDDATPTDSEGTTSKTGNPTNTRGANGNAATSDPAGNAAAKVTWMCASSLLAVLTAAFMAL